MNLPIYLFFHFYVIMKSLNKMRYKPQEKRWKIKKKQEHVMMEFSIITSKKIFSTRPHTFPLFPLIVGRTGTCSLTSFNNGRWPFYAQLFIAAHTQKLLCMLWFFHSFKVGVCSLLEDSSKKLSTSKVTMFSCKNRDPFPILTQFLILYHVSIFSRWDHGGTLLDRAKGNKRNW